jgi:hypothetical protein
MKMRGSLDPRTVFRRFGHYMDCGALPLLADPAGHGAVGFCGAVCGGVLPGAGVAAFGGVGADSGVSGFVPGFFCGGFPVEFVGGMFPGAGTQGPFAGTGAGVVGGVLPEVPWGGVV